jgi:glycosyltransferase involved in cell wall biosynthesis
MMKIPTLSVVVPLFNEEDNIVLLQDEIAKAVSGIDYELILVDDGCTDRTIERIKRNEVTRILRLDRNSGQSAAMYAGIHAAKGEVIALLDGDLQNDPVEIPAMMKRVLEDEADLVCGYRAKRKDTWSKRMTSRIANSVRSRFIGDGVRDTGCTLKTMRRECRDLLVPFYGMHRFIPALIKGGGYRLVEMPVNHRARHSGKSKYGFGNRAIKATMDMFGVAWLLSRQLKYKVQEE